MIRQEGSESIKIIPESEGDKSWKFLLVSYFTVPNFLDLVDPRSIDIQIHGHVIHEIIVKPD